MCVLAKVVKLTPFSKKVLVKDYPITDQLLVEVPEGKQFDFYRVYIGDGLENIDIEIRKDYAIMISDCGLEISEPIDDNCVVNLMGLVKTYYSEVANYYIDFTQRLIGQTLN